MIFLTGECPQPAAEFGAAGDSLCAASDSLSSSRFSPQWSGHCSECQTWATTGYVHASLTHVCLRTCSKKKRMWIYNFFCSVSVSCCRDSTSAFHLCAGDCWDTLTFSSDKWLILCSTVSRRPLLTFPHLCNGVFFTSFGRCEMCVMLESRPLPSLSGSRNLTAVEEINTHQAAKINTFITATCLMLKHAATACCVWSEAEILEWRSDHQALSFLYEKRGENKKKRSRCQWCCARRWQSFVSMLLTVCCVCRRGSSSLSGF